MLRRLASTTALCAIGAVALSGAGQALTQRDADSLQRKLDAVIARGALEPPTAKSLRTTVTDREVNAYFKFQGAQQLPVGVVNPNVQILDLGRVTGVITVNLDAVRLSKERGWTDPIAYMSGTMEVHVVGVLHAANGKGTFDLESATLGAVPLPKALLQTLVSFYTRTPESPNGFSLDQPFELPQRIRQVDLQRGSAVIVQ